MTKFCIRGRHVVRIGFEKLDKVLTDMVCFIEHNETVMKKSEEKHNAECQFILLWNFSMRVFRRTCGDFGKSVYNPKDQAEQQAE